MSAQAGPPFLTDDPEPTETGHWEIYAPSLEASGKGRDYAGGAGVGDFLDKPLDQGGLALSRDVASLVLLVANVASVRWPPQRAARAG
jgi:hypothetical protein